MVKLERGQAILQLKFELNKAKLLSVLTMNQMFIVATTNSLYQVPMIEPTFRSLIHFQSPIQQAILFSARTKIFLLGFDSKKKEIKIFSTLKQLQFKFIFKIRLKKFDYLKFFKKEKMLVLWRGKRIQLVDLAKLLLRKQGAIQEMKMNQKILRVLGYYERELDQGIDMVVQSGELHQVIFFHFIII